MRRGEEAVEEILRQAVSVVRKLPPATSLARLWFDCGRWSEVRERLAPIYEWFAEGFDTPDLQVAKALLDALG